MGSDLNNNQMVGYAGSYLKDATRLAAGTTINSGSAFVYNNCLVVLGSRFNGKNCGQLRTRGFVGFEFTAAGGEHYGYLNLQATPAGTGTVDTNYTAKLAFFSGAYQSTPNTPITIPAAVPEPTSLAALAFGGAGLAGAAAHRRKKAARTAA